MSLIDYREIEVRQEDMHVLGDVTFTVEQGEFVYLIGKVGSGKSSLINMLTKHKGLAMTSSTPGKTLLINHYIINGDI